MEREREMNNPSVEHYYLARIVMTIVALFHKNPSSLKLENFLIKFSSGQATPATPEESVNKSKSIWAAMAGRLGFRRKPPTTGLSLNGISAGE